jgi:(p)ppGpp synthase/HD superfamily hydrolase
MKELAFEHRERAESNDHLVLVLKAAEFAAYKHQGQRRKGRTKRPYIGHCVEVARMIADVAKSDDPTILSAAILHDVLEDTDTTRDELSREFSERIADFVSQVTDDKSLPKAERKKLQVEHAPHLSPGAKLIKLADKISNVREIGTDPPKGWSRKRREKYFKWAEDVVEAMGSVNDDLEKEFKDAITQSREKLEAEKKNKASED